MFSKCLNTCFVLRLSDRNSFLENSLGEKEQKLLSTTEKLEQIETLKKLLQEKDLLNKELGEKFVHTEQKVSYSSVVLSLLQLVSISYCFLFLGAVLLISLSKGLCSLHVVALLQVGCKDFLDPTQSFAWMYLFYCYPHLLISK